MTTALGELADRWRRESNQYQKQVEECRSKGLPCEQMLSMMLCLRSCARDLDAVQLIPNTPPQADQRRSTDPGAIAGHPMNSSDTKK